LVDHAHRSLGFGGKDTAYWASYEIPFLFEQGRRPDLIKLNVVIEGTGTLWIKDVELLKGELPPRQDRAPQQSTLGCNQEHGRGPMAQKPAQPAHRSPFR